MSPRSARTGDSARSASARRRDAANATSPDDAIDALYGLGPFSRRLLEAAGIHTRADLERHGAVGAYLAVQAAGGKPSLNLLWGLAAALTNTHWAKLGPDHRAALLLEYDARRGDALATPRPRGPGNAAKRAPKRLRRNIVGK